VARGRSAAPPRGVLRGGERGPVEGPLTESLSSSRRFVVAAAAVGQRLDAFLARQIGEVSRSQLARQIGQAAVTVNGAVGVPSRKLRAGDLIVWEPPPVVATELRAEAISLTIVHEDRWLVVIDKPAGLVVHPAPGHEAGTLVNALLAHVKDLRGIGGELRPGIVHRIDKDTSGLLVVAKDDQTMNALAAEFKAHTIERVYEALVAGAPPGASGRVDTFYGRDPRDRKKFSSRVRTGKRAVTNWRVTERFPGAARMEARLETGRTHQVRVHLAALGCPLLGDKVYGRPPRDPELRAIAEALGRQALHARALGFVHPATGKKLSFSAEPPADMRAALAALEAL
jgi:23S rRNA pseudouridine1911/1915/1917 synthase